MPHCLKVSMNLFFANMCSPCMLKSQDEDQSILALLKYHCLYDHIQNNQHQQSYCCICIYMLKCIHVLRIRWTIYKIENKIEVLPILVTYSFLLIFNLRPNNFFFSPYNIGMILDKFISSLETINIPQIIPHIIWVLLSQEVGNQNGLFSVFF